MSSNVDKIFCSANTQICSEHQVLYESGRLSDNMSPKTRITRKRKGVLNNIEGHLELKGIRTLSRGDQHIREEADAQSQRRQKKYNLPVSLRFLREKKRIRFPIVCEMVSRRFYVTLNSYSDNDCVNKHNICSPKTQT